MLTHHHTSLSIPGTVTGLSLSARDEKPPVVVEDPLHAFFLFITLDVNRLSTLSAGFPILDVLIPFRDANGIFFGTKF